MWDSRKVLSGKRKYLFGLILCLISSAVYLVFNMGGNDDYDMARREILLRRLGHELLLQSGDDSSRVLPVEKMARNEYRIKFENELSFQPDSLVSASQRVLAKDLLARDYIVNVLNQQKPGVVFGYAVSGNKKDNIVACLGREQPKARYIIQIKLKPTEISTSRKGYLLGSLPVLALVGFIFLKSARPRTALNERHDQTFKFGLVLFDAQKRHLVIHHNTIDLTETESRLLLIFALSPDETIDRRRLQKEIWEDEGVIVGRSLDMFISKLRKKLEGDPNIKIAVVRGKGYKLETV